MSNQEAKQRYFDKKYKEAPFIKCACGCDVKIKSMDKYGRSKTFISGHNSKKYIGKDATIFASNKRWKKKNPEIIRDNKKAYYRKRKLMAMDIMGNKCNLCSKKYNGKNAPIFEFHHIDPAKKEYGITRMLINKAWIKTLEELKQCILVCANCHNQYHGGIW